MNRIKQLRMKNGVTIAQLSEKTGIPKTSLTNYENSKRTPRNIETWEVLADFFEVDVPYLMGLYDGTPKEWNTLNKNLNTQMSDTFASYYKKNVEKLFNFLEFPEKEAVNDLINIFISVAEGYFYLYENDETKKRFEAYRKVLFKIEKYATLSSDGNNNLPKQFLDMHNDELAIKEFFELAFYLLLEENS